MMREIVIINNGIILICVGWESVFNDGMQITTHYYKHEKFVITATPVEPVPYEYRNKCIYTPKPKQWLKPASRSQEPHKNLRLAINRGRHWDRKAR